MADEKLELYEPINTLKPVDRNIWMVDGPIIKMDFPLGIKAPFPTRMVVAKLDGDRLWIHSPIAPDDRLYEQIEALGTPTWLIAPNSIHYWYIPDWLERYPDAQVHAVPGLTESAKRPVKVDEILTDVAPDRWQENFDLQIFPGSIVTEAVFYHRPSKTVILTDLIENFELAKVNSRWLRFLLKFAGNVEPDGKAPIDLRMTFWKHREIFAKKAMHMLAWDAEKVIMAHGRPYLKDGDKELRRAFRWVQGVKA